MTRYCDEFVQTQLEINFISKKKLFETNRPKMSDDSKFSVANDNKKSNICESWSSNDVHYQ